MTDQAAGQSGSVETASGNAPERDLAAAFQKTLSGEQPEGQADTEQREQAQAEDGETPANVDEQAADPDQPEMIRVPSLEGDGFEELPVSQVKAERLMHADYTRKTQQVAKEREAVQAKAREIEQVQTAKLQSLDEQIQTAARVIQSFEENVDWQALMEFDPPGYIRAKEAQAQRVRLVQQAAQHAQQMRQQATQQRKQEEAQRLVEAIPEWLDTKRALAEVPAIVRDVSAYGYAADEFENSLDHRLVVMARDALAYRALKAKSAEVKATASKAPPITKPGAARQQGNPQALRTHRTIQTAMAKPTNDNLAAAFNSVLFAGKK